ncbi:MAG: outer membrane beta-barrel protein [Cyclobacteriaceae bacterium]|nr:outer membrane beta-barrel protein [Cyclobacteriaceae bacterium]
MRKLWVFIALLLLANICFSQSFYAIRKDRALILTAGTGTSTYLGDLANDGDYFDAKGNLNFGLQYYFTPRISVRAEVAWFRLAGSDIKAGHPDRVGRNLTFQSNNYELNATGMINLFENGNRYYRRPAYNFYAFGGIGLTYFNPTAEYLGKKYVLQPLQTEGVSYSRVTPAIPLGIGFRLRMGPNLNIALESGYRIVFTDYLDDVSTVYPATYSSPESELLSIRGATYAVPGYIRGNPDKKDAYIIYQVKFEYYLPWDLGGKGSGRIYSKKRSSFYRYNKKGGFKR